MTDAPVVLAISRVSPTWSEWPCVSTMWVTPRAAAALSEINAGLPVMNGSINTALPSKSSRKAEWPYQVICMSYGPSLGGLFTNRLLTRNENAVMPPAAVHFGVDLPPLAGRGKGAPVGAAAVRVIGPRHACPSPHRGRAAAAASR